MDQFAVPSSTQPNCGHPSDFACLQPESAGASGIYHQLADTGALADHYFQILGDGFVNAKYFAFTSYRDVNGPQSGEAITSLLPKQLVTWALYVEDPRLVSLLMQSFPTHYDARWSFHRWYDEFWRDLELEQLAPVSVILRPMR